MFCGVVFIHLHVYILYTNFHMYLNICFFKKYFCLCTTAQWIFIRSEVETVLIQWVQKNITLTVQQLQPCLYTVHRYDQVMPVSLSFLDKLRRTFFGQMKPQLTCTIIGSEKYGGGVKRIMIWRIPHYLLKILEAVLWHGHV